MLKVVKNILDRVNECHIDYCHWKSNNLLKECLENAEELDLLVEESRRSDFEHVIKDLGFLETHEPFTNRHIHIVHYYGLDLETGLLVHLHVYYRLITGGAMVKNHYFPISDHYFKNLQHYHGVSAPCPEIEMILLMIRKTIEYYSHIERFFLKRELIHVRNELIWLQERIDRTKLNKVRERLFPGFSEKMLSDAIELFMGQYNFKKGYHLGKKFNLFFRGYTLKHPIIAELKRCIMFFKLVIDVKILKPRIQRWINPKGMVLSFVGSEACGKTTSIKEVEKWLLGAYDVRMYHCGKPPASVYTILFRYLISFYVLLKARFRTASSNKELVKEQREAENIPHPVVSLLDSIDRLCLTNKLHKLKEKGVIVLTDRYPNNNRGAIDGPRIPEDCRWSFLINLELYFYKKVKPIDHLLKLYAPLEVTLERNAKRDNPEPESFVRMRYEKFHSQKFNTSMSEINTNVSFGESFRTIKGAIWTFIIRKYK